MINEECFHPKENADLYYLNLSIDLLNKANNELAKMIPSHLLPFFKNLRRGGILSSGKFTIINNDAP